MGINFAKTIPGVLGTEDTWGAKMYEALGARDAQWISEIYGWIQTTPLTASQKMGLPAAQVLGSYDPSNPEHNAQDPASWVVPTWKKYPFPDMRRRRKADVPRIQCDRYFVHGKRIYI